MPDLNMIGKYRCNHCALDLFHFLAERTDETELSRLLQLVLGCAVNCEQRQFYIEHIMTMEASVQIVLMNAIQEVCIEQIEFSKQFDLRLDNGQRKSKTS